MVSHGKRAVKCRDPGHAQSVPPRVGKQRALRSNAGCELSTTEKTGRRASLGHSEEKLVCRRGTRGSPFAKTKERRNFYQRAWEMSPF